MRALALLVMVGACASEPATLGSGTYRATLTTISDCPGRLARDQTWDISVQSQNYSILDVVDTSRAFTIYSILAEGGMISGEVDGDNEVAQLQGWGVDDAAWFAEIEIRSDRDFGGWLDVTSPECSAHYQVIGTRADR